MSAFEPVIGLEVHVELQTRTKMFCGCAVVDSASAPPNAAVCDVCLGLPGTLPVINAQAVTFAAQIALALHCRVRPVSLFARKNYFYPDLPKGYQISQYEIPLAEEGWLAVPGEGEAKRVRIRRVHLEEDTGKLVHKGEASLIDFNRSGVALAEIVTEPDLHTLEEVKAFALELRAVLRYLGVTSGDMEKGAMRFEANVSLRPAGSQSLGTRTEIKNLNSFRAMLRALAFEIDRQERLLAAGGAVLQETLGWDEARGVTLSQRGKEEAHDYRYFPEPDLPPLELDSAWIDGLRAGLPQLPGARRQQFESLGLTPSLAATLAAERATADYFEAAHRAAPAVPPIRLAHWIVGELFGHLPADATGIAGVRIRPEALAELVAMVEGDYISPATGKALLQRLVQEGGSPSRLAAAGGLDQISEPAAIDAWIDSALNQHAPQVEQYLAGKTAVAQWLFGQVMRAAGGRAKPSIVQARLTERLKALEERRRPG
ncbi:MAG TPA: Asp-tRNA(Asn)/Glu-tRNA(Gln) amidotransferase subunit GatB [Anaerolineales bacterium]|nr:Asp-tRNA(Asn)/Glu-tRNA(Gln) amidotransferase subunit GatB [Anaerolineales bacterium]